MVFVEMQSKQCQYSIIIPRYNGHCAHQLPVAGMGDLSVGVDGECILVGSVARGPHWME